MATYNRKDHFYEKAKAEGYRSRAAYKLVELNKKYKFLAPGSTVVDLGCFPGGWLQIAQERVGPSGLVVGIDLNDVEPITVKGGEARGPVILKGDFTKPEMRAEILSLIGGKADAVLSDLSPKLSGIKFQDSCRSAELVELAYDFAREVLDGKGTLIAKIFPGHESDELALKFKKTFSRFARMNLDSSRKTSTELYFLAQQMRRS